MKKKEEEAARLCTVMPPPKAAASVTLSFPSSSLMRCGVGGSLRWRARREMGGQVFFLFLTMLHSLASMRQGCWPLKAEAGHQLCCEGRGGAAVLYSGGWASC